MNKVSSRARPTGGLGFGVFLFIFVLFPSWSAGADVLPWEIWKDPGAMARIPAGLHTVLSSSCAPGEGALDRHSAGDSRFIRISGSGGVIFSARSPGVLTRIWMTQGNGTAKELDRSIVLRIRIDGMVKPVVDEPVRDFFSRRSNLVRSFSHHGGGNISRLPIAFARSCEVSLLGAESSKIWFQVTAMLFDTPGISPGITDSREYSEILRRVGHDPWPREGGETLHGKMHLNPGESLELGEIDGPGRISGLVLDLPRKRWKDLRIRMEFDDLEATDMPLPWFFGIPGPECPGMESVLAGVHGGLLYSYFPMPFFTKARISLHLDHGDPVGVEYSLRFSLGELPADTGLFHAGRIDAFQSRPGEAARLLDVEGPVRLVGLAVTSGGVRNDWSFLEGDEIVYCDGKENWHGTGVEDFFGGGFYFRNASRKTRVFRGPLSGLSCLSRSREYSASMYRMMPIDGPVAFRHLEFFWEGGSENRDPTRWRGTAYYYRIPRPCVE